MSKVPTITSASAFAFSLGGERVLVMAQGLAPTSGWSSSRLSPHFYVIPPAHGYWEFDFLADEPLGVVLQVQLPLAASGIFSPPQWMKGVRVIAEDRSIDIQVDKSAKSARSIPKAFTVRPLGHVIVREQLASYDDSFNPIGFCSGFGSIKMKKLHHTLTLVVEGPDENRIRQCIAKAVGDGLIAAIIAAYATAGLALQAAVTAFLSSLKGCLDDKFSMRIDDESHWVKWCT